MTLPAAAHAAALVAAAPEPDMFEPDVLVIGGGPAGSSAATLRARKGWRVTVPEKACHRRFPIGESLLPINIPILERLGVLEQVRAIGMLKLGADFPAYDGHCNNFPVNRAHGASYVYPFHVTGDEFDRLPCEHARRHGAGTREPIQVEPVDFANHGAISVHARSAADAQAAVNQAFRPRYLIDASGRDAFLDGKPKLKRKNGSRHQSTAVFGHFSGALRRPAAVSNVSNVSIFRHQHGRLSMIPLRDDVISVGAVCSPECFKTRQGDTNVFPMRTLQSGAEAQRRMDDATRVAPVHVIGNYAYECTCVSGPDEIMLAYAYAVPMSSSGVLLAMNSAELGADAVGAALRTPARERIVLRELQRRLTRGLDEFKWFIYQLITPTMKAPFASPRNLWQTEPAVISMLAGDMFDSKAGLRRLRVFRLIHAPTALRIASAAARARLRHRRQVDVAVSDATLQRGSP